MKERFDLLLNEYLKDDSQLVDSNKNYYNSFINEVPQILYIYFDNEKYLIKSSIGAGQKSEIPWVCIFNRSITTSATQGIYICFLFRKDMTGFYLALGQGITTFEEVYGTDKYINITKVASYFKNLIDNDEFDKESIDLKGNKPLSKGYEKGTIISKFYEKNNYDDSVLLKDLNSLKQIYDDISEDISNTSYMEIVKNVVNNMDPSHIAVEEANKVIEKALLEESDKNGTEIISLELVEIPKYKKKNKYSQITKKVVKKIDYVKKAKLNAKNGLLGEELVMSYERERLTKLGKPELADEIKWIAKENDGTGYDIISFDIDDNNNVIEKYIEIKTTEGNDTNHFYISANEIDVMEKLKNQYCIYRVYNLKTNHPKLFVLEYNDFKTKLKLDVEGYIASFINE